MHAYLFVGPASAGVHDAMMSFAAALQCPEHGCGHCATCRLVIDEAAADVYVAERAGVNWRIEELREAERVSRRRPLDAGYQVIVLDDVSLAVSGPTNVGAALLKSIEEPPARTIFLLSAPEVSPELTTISSRCVHVRLRPLDDDALYEVLVREGADPDDARLAARGANGDLERARVLVTDPSLASRIESWRSVPERLRGTSASASQLALELSGLLDEAIGPLVRRQEFEAEKRTSEAKEFGRRVAKADMTTQFKREQRRFRLEELRVGLSTLANAYRERFSDALAPADAGDTRARQRVGASLAAIDTLNEAYQRLGTNVDESLSLT